MNGWTLVDGYNAPLTAGNFVDLVQRGYYNNRVLKKSDTALLVDTRAGSKAAAAAAAANDAAGAGAGAAAGEGEEGASEAAAAAAIEARWGRRFPFVFVYVYSRARSTEGGLDGDACMYCTHVVCITDSDNNGERASNRQVKGGYLRYSRMWWCLCV